jgi:hypothetical protein
MKTPEELAHYYADRLHERIAHSGVFVEGFVAGYQVAKEHAHAALEEAESRIDELQSKLSDAGILTTEHLLGADNSSNNSNGWISVKDRLPEVGERVLIYVPATDGDCDHWIADFQMQGKWQMFGYNATHWMPLPKPPEE